MARSIQSDSKSVPGLIARNWSANLGGRRFMTVDHHAKSIFTALRHELAARFQAVTGKVAGMGFDRITSPEDDQIAASF